MLRAFGHPVAMCWGMLGLIGSNLTKVTFFMQHLYSFGQVCAPVLPTSLIFNTQHVLTRRNTLAKRSQHVEILRLFGRGFQVMGQQCCELLAGVLLGLDCEPLFRTTESAPLPYPSP